MTTQSDALLGLVGAYADLTEDERALKWSQLFGNPIICTHTVYELALANADAYERTVLEDLQRESLLVVSDDPQAERARLATRPGYENRGARRARKRGKGGKSK